MKKTGTNIFRSKEITWLAFNRRVLQEAADPRVPLPERIRFLGIYSQNMDEFFRVRVSNLMRLISLGREASRYMIEDPAEVLVLVKQAVIEQRREFELIYDNTISELKRDHSIRFLQIFDLTVTQREFIRDYFEREVRHKIFPTMIYHRYRMSELKDHSLYLAVELKKTGTEMKPHYSVVEIPVTVLPRFIDLPAPAGEQHIMFIDEVVRFGLPSIFAVRGFDSFRSYNIKLTQDAELDFDDDISLSYIDKIYQSLHKRREGAPVRFVYDSAIPPEMLDLIVRKMKLDPLVMRIAGGRYHYLSDFINLPEILRLPSEERPEPIPHPTIKKEGSILSSIRERDHLLFFPYHSFLNFIDFLREVSLDPKVESIRINLYRVARNSSVINALINARKNRKEVFVLLELQARFNEEENLSWADTLRNEGVKVVFGIQGLKVHSKLCLVTRRKGEKTESFAVIGTGNFNEDSSRSYTDFCLLTAKRHITHDVELLFDFFETRYKLKRFKHLIVSPFMFRDKMTALVRDEIQNRKEGKEAYILLKMNNLADPELVRELYRASRAGVNIRLIVRSRFTCIPGLKKLSENIEAVSIVDLLLEHSRYFIFAAGGECKVFISSADWQTRNIDRRIEVTTPIEDPAIKETIRQVFELQWSDNVKARILDRDLSNRYREGGGKRIRSQTEMYRLIKSLS